MEEITAAQCVICGHRGRGPAAPFHMTHGVSVWLCATHREPRYLRRRGGRVFTERLHAVWASAGRATAKHLRALDAHRNRMRLEPARRERPGSYSWPRLRRTAEDRFAAGEDPDAVIRDLRAVYAHHAARVPSVRTMRRWHAQARWMQPDSPAAAAALTPSWLRRPDWLRRPRVTRWPNLHYDLGPVYHPFGIFLFLWVDDRPHTGHWRRR